MAATIALAEHGGKQPSAPSISLRLDFTGDTSYPTGGYAFDPAAELQSKAGYDKPPVILGVVIPAKADHIFEWDRATKKLLYRVGSTGAEVANTTDVSVTPGLIEVLILAE